jgi:hypothetical protein
MRLKLQHAAHVRAGDKGNTSSISAIAYEPELYPVLKEQLTAERFKAFYGDAIKGEVRRYEIDGLCALNFVCEGALGGGVSRSLCLDNYGKALSSAILGFELEVPERLSNHLRGMGCAPTDSATSRPGRSAKPA